ncbi:hypothetical protein [Brumicola blandensis]|uniref:Outer membrane protein beta-barrel domain-containing protein n=1 Tax=Brumicola blandensis TaxID=3075611 RepID=A0AAW8QZ93_9ALTE|nr:hypothetical protein [Alteromonas sp. W409]MDT0582357.1 hypothetical protein [Alteromonas sp. W409]
MKIKLTTALLCISMMALSSQSSAKDRVTMFVKKEINDTDTISALGFSGILSDHYSNIKSEIITSLNAATVLDNSGYYQDYLGLDLGVRLGYYDDVFLYIEGGFDVFESAFKDDDEFDNHYNDRDNLDGYAALGWGIQSGNLRVEGYVKARQIDAEYWTANKTLFYGMQFTFAF